jgi:CBS domain-containing protein
MGAIAAKAPLDGTMVDDLMSKTPITVKNDADADEAAALMSEKGVRRVIALDDAGKPVGVISLGDLGLRLEYKETVSNVLAQLGKRAMK